MSIRRLAITGSSGYFGEALVRHFRQQPGDVRILGVDVRDPHGVSPDEFANLDILSDKLADVLAAFGPDTVIHSAFAMHPRGNARRMRRVNVEGCRNLLDAMDSISPARLMIVSSATVYGAWPDNPVPLEETSPIRSGRGFHYAMHKAEVEELVTQFAGQHPAIAVSLVRPTLIGGPGMDNYMKRLLFRLPRLVLIDGCDTPVQFVHEEDAAAAIGRILQADGRGVFNVAPPDWIRLSDIAAATNRRTVRLPMPLVRFIAYLARFIRRPGDRVPPGFLHYIRCPWVVTPARLTHELGFQFRHSSRDTLQEIIRGTQ